MNTEPAKKPYLVLVIKRDGYPYESAVPHRVDAVNADAALVAAFGQGPPAGKEAHTALVWELANPVELTHVPIEAHAPTWGTPRRFTPPGFSSAAGSG